MVGSGAARGWLGTLWVLLLAPAAAVPQLNVCKDTLALPTAGFGGPCPGSPKFHSGLPTPGLVPSIIREMEAEGM